MENKMDIVALRQQWQQLLTEVENKRRLNDELFKDVFAQTYQLLKTCPEDTKLEKAYLPLIIAAHNFSIADREQAEAKCAAASVLTERMLHRCLMDPEAVGIPQGTTVYVLEERKDLYLDFNDVNLAMEKLTALMHTRELL